MVNNLAGLLPKAALLLANAAGVTLLMHSPVVQADQPAQRMIEEVVVTASRRAESLQSVPIAVTAFSEEDIRSRRIDGLAALSNRSPGFAMGEFMPSQPQVYIRGIGSNDDGPAADPSTAVFVDEVYVGRAAGWTANLFDLERVEVLRGPQGTLYGKNVVGGAVNLISRRPDENFRAAINTSVGTFNLREFQGMVSTPLTDNLFGKIAYSRKSRDGYLKSMVGDFPEFFPQRDPNSLGKIDQLNRDTEAVRANLRWLPTEALEVNIAVDNAQLDEIAPAFHRIGPDADGVRLLSGLIENYQNRPRTNLKSEPGITKNETTGVMARIDYDLGWSTFTSLSAYRESETLNTGCCGLPNEQEALLEASSPNAEAGMRLTFAPKGNEQNENAEQWSQEFRFTSTGAGPLEWVGGLYYYKENAIRTESFDFGLAVLDGVGGLNILVPSSLGISFQDAETESYAVFGQGTWSVNDRLRLTAGARWSRDEKSVRSIVQQGGLLFRESFDVDVSKSWSELTPRFVIDYQWSDDVFVYLTAAKGFKSGGFQGQPPAQINAELPFEPETAWLYEAGVRSDWFNRRVRANLSVFHTDYDDLQIRQSLIPPGTPPGQEFVVAVVQNAASAEVRGAELELTLLPPVEGLTITASYAYLDATFKEFFAPPGFTTPTGVDINQRAGNRLRNSPKHSLSVLAQYEMTLAGGNRMTYALDWRYQDRLFQDPDNAPLAAIDSYSLLDARASYMTADGQWEVSLWVENLLNEDYFIHNFPATDGGVTTPGAPRMGGVTVRWSM
ncbi:MAG: TonB-dependent receptor [Gammaproteobacteria bacterium]|nr:TonB-dependent receptor [Gammaproteobacteria bacterium]